MSSASPSRAEERTWMAALIERVVQECPRRQPTSPDERRAQEILAGELERLGLATEWHGFEFNDNLYANLALHFGLGTAGTLLSCASPLLALGLHSLAAGSYWADSTRRAYVLRRLLRFKPSQNLLATLPAQGEPRLRIVLAAHADAAFTGLLFDPRLVRALAGHPPKPLRFLRRSMELATKTQAALACFDLLRVVLGPLALPLRPLELLLGVPGLLAFLLSLEITLRNEIVPGANDDLSGVAALPILAQRLAATKPDDVELVFAVTGCEEASLGGADALARDRATAWDQRKTVFIALDGLSLGALDFVAVEGEVVRTPVPEWLCDTLRSVAATDERFGTVQGFEIPVGGTDAGAFLARGWDAVGIVCVDPELGSPRHYHQPSDRPEHLDYDEIQTAMDFTERLVHEIVRRRLGEPGA